MLSLKHLLTKAVYRAGISRQVSATNLIQTVNQFLDAAMLSEMRPMARVISFQAGRLKIHCKNSVAAHEIKMLEDGIREVALAADPRSDLQSVFIQIRSMEAYDV